MIKIVKVQNLIDLAIEVYLNTLKQLKNGLNNTRKELGTHDIDIKFNKTIEILNTIYKNYSSHQLHRSLTLPIEGLT